MRFLAQGVVLASLTAALGGGVAAAPADNKSVASEVVDAAPLKLGRGIADVVLTDETGREIAWRELDGRPRAVFFGFTRCPVICPVTVWELDAALKKIGKRADGLKLVFVSLDPVRDTPAVLKSYFSSFGGRVRGLTGSVASIERVAKAFEVVRERVALSGDDYTLDHTAAVFLTNSRGDVVDTLAYGTPQDVIVKRLENLLADEPVRKN